MQQPPDQTGNQPPTQPADNWLASATARLRALPNGPARRLDGSDEQMPSWHLWRQTEVNAVTLALASQRPLLVRGEPGTGKSQLARAAAVALGWRLHTHTLHVRSEPQDLLYQFDAVRRLGDAQADRLGDDEKKYWQPQALWQALNWELAHDYGSLRLMRGEGASLAAPAGHVVLIDEIDKAPSDVPNGLLEVLGARCFEIPGIPLRVSAGNRGGAGWPLVIITTNEERELPAAFLRRCMVLNHDADAIGDYQGFLVTHGQAHFGNKRESFNAGHDIVIEEALMNEAARQLLDDRQRAKSAQLPVPGLAEYLDLLSALHQLAPGDPEQQRYWLGELNQYAFLKNRIDDGGDERLRQNASGTRGLAGRAE